MELRLWQITLNHPKIRALTDRDFRLLIEVAAYIASCEDLKEIDGLVHEYELNRINRSYRSTLEGMRRLASAGVVQRLEHLKAWQFPDWTTSADKARRGLLTPEQIAWGQPPLSRILHARNRHAEAMRAYRARQIKTEPPDWAKPSTGTATHLPIQASHIERNKDEETH